jgi:hypothetical protein
MAVIFLMFELWGFAPTFCHTQDYQQNDISMRIIPLFLRRCRYLVNEDRTAFSRIRLLRK